MTTTLNRWNPIRQLEDLQHNLLTAFCPTDRVYPVDGSADVQTRASWIPVMDVTENDKGYLITAELPGVRKEDITVMLEHDVVNVRGERKPGYGEEGESPTWHLSERHFGTFERSISLPKDIDSSSLEAELKEGILFLRLAKKEEARPRLIEVS
jgi:HSP20 family protein